MISSAIMLCFTGPDAFVPALLSGAREAASSCITLFCIYAVWMGLSRVSEDAGINRAIAKKMQPVCKKIFRAKGASGGEYAAMNLTCNILGLGGAATPYGVKACREFDAEGNLFGRNLVFILNAASVQIVPSTIISLRASYGSAAPADIFVPSVICTAACTGLAVALYLLYCKICRS